MEAFFIYLTLNLLEMSKFVTMKNMLFFLLISGFAYTAKAEDKLIQFSGFVVTPARDSMMPVSYAQVFNKNKKFGTTASFEGYFSLVAAPGDSLIFRCVGFKEITYIIPLTISGTKFTAVQVMTREMGKLPEVVIVPWNTLSDFKLAFVELNLNQDDLIKAQQNLARERLEQAEQAMAFDATEISYYSLQNQQAYNANRYALPSSNFTNPLAWIKFAQAIKNGDFKKKKK